MLESIGQWTVPVTFGSLLSFFAVPHFFRVIARYTARRPLLEIPVVPRAAVASVLGWMLLLLFSKAMGSRAETLELSLLAIQISCGLNLLIALLLPLLLTEGGQRRREEAGLSLTDKRDQLRMGFAGCLASLGPTLVLLVFSQFWRTMETEHVFLNALRNAQRAEIIAWISVSAVIAAPLAEELLFRVTLQGWLSERFSDSAAIVLTALFFAIIHGWRDALPLMPLALILGYAYQKTRRYWVCVVTHGLFNATNLLLTFAAG